MRWCIGGLALCLFHIGYLTECAVPTNNGYKILMIAPFESKSMRNVFMPVGKGLVLRGHDVTLLGSVPVQPEEDLGGVKVKIIDKIWEFFLTYNDDMYESPSLTTSVYLERFYKFVLRLTDIFLQTDTCRELLDIPENSYDLVIVNGLVGEFALPFVHKLARHKVLLIPPEMMTWIADGLDLPHPFSYVPFTLTDLPTKMTFVQRAVNVWESIKVNFRWKYSIVPAMNDKIQQQFPEAPTIKEVQKKISLVIVNSEPVLRIPKPTMPYVKDIGGMHCRPAMPLQKEYSNIIDQVGDEGFIVFSLGSILKASLLPDEVKQKIVSVLSRLTQTVLWKYEEEIEDLPKNVKLFKWMPQQDLLGHPKIRLLITHCGLISLQEAVYHGVPILGIPVFAEQPGNLARVLERGIGKKLDLTNFSEESMYQSIQELLTDERYRDAVRRNSIISRDQMNRPVNQAVYWLEYVIRHDGAPHLRTAADHLNFWQYFLLDIIAAIIAGIILIFICFFMLTKMLINIFSKTEKEMERENKKKKKKTK